MLGLVCIHLSVPAKADGDGQCSRNYQPVSDIVVRHPVDAHLHLSMEKVSEGRTV